MMNIEDAIRQKEKDLWEFLATIKMPTLDKILSDLQTLKRSQNILREMDVEVSAPPVIEKVGDNKPETAAPISPKQYATMGDAAVGMIKQAGKPMSLKDLHTGVLQLGFTPKTRTSFRSLLDKDRRARFEMLGGGMVGLSATAGDAVEASGGDAPKRRTLAEFGFSLKQSIIDLLPQLHGEFSQPIIYTKLCELNPEVAPYIQKASISATLTVLVKDGVIRETFKGLGSDPRRYEAVLKAVALDFGT